MGESTDMRLDFLFLKSSTEDALRAMTFEELLLTIFF